MVMGLAGDIKGEALEAGFDLVGITDTASLTAGQCGFFNDWLSSGFAGQMDYMGRNVRQRLNPAALLEDAQSVICLGLNYKPPEMPNEPLRPAIPMGKVANYARYEDYHLFIKKLLHRLTGFISSVAGSGFRFRVFVDSAPVAERTLAAKAGLGFIGRNHILISPKFGPQVFLAEIITNLRFQTDVPIKADCYNCEKCIAACPTGALRTDGRFDANKCISYLTIENKGQIPADLAEKIGDRLFGCDECVSACPYCEKSPECANKQFKFYPDRVKLNLNEILAMNEQSFESGFADSCFKRTGLELLKRNAEICLANTADKRRQQLFSDK